MHVDLGARMVFVGMLTRVIWGLLPFYTAALPGHAGRARARVPRAGLCSDDGRVVFLFKQHKDVFALFREPKWLAAYTLAALVLSVNWTTFFWRLQHGFVLELSFATYLLPLCLHRDGRDLSARETDALDGGGPDRRRVRRRLDSVGLHRRRRSSFWAWRPRSRPTPSSARPTASRPSPASVSKSASSRSLPWAICCCTNYLHRTDDSILHILWLLSFGRKRR